MASFMKFSYLMGKAPADFSGMASKLYPIVVSTAPIRAFGLTANQFIFLLAAFEMAIGIGFFFNNKTPAIMTGVVMAGAEYIAYVHAANPSMPASPVCTNKSVACMESHVFHLVLIIMAGMSYFGKGAICHAWSKSGCSSWCQWCGKSSKSSAASEARTPSRPRRAAAMKNKKDE